MTALANNLRAFITDGAARAVAFRLTMASTMAMAVAFALSLDNPWWAAMAVWMIGQPPRGLLIERCGAQLVGTILGAVAGVALILLGTKYTVASIASLALWIGICCGVANAMRHQRAYGAALCGLTSAVVVSLTLGTQVDPWGFALARVADSVIGIAASLLVAFIPGPVLRGPSIGERARRTMADAIDLVAESLGNASKRTSEHERGFLMALAALEASAEDLAAGSLAGRRNLRDLNALLSLLLDLIVIARAIRHREGAVTAPGHAAMIRLRQAFEKDGRQAQAW